MNFSKEKIYGVLTLFQILILAFVFSQATSFSSAVILLCICLMFHGAVADFKYVKKLFIKEDKTNETKLG